MSPVFMGDSAGTPAGRYRPATLEVCVVSASQAPAGPGRSLPQTTSAGARPEPPPAWPQEDESHEQTATYPVRRERRRSHPHHKAGQARRRPPQREARAGRHPRRRRADSIEKFERAIIEAQDLVALWRAVDAGALPVTDPSIRRLLTAERHYLETEALPDDREALERIQAGQNLYGGTRQEQEAQAQEVLDRTRDRLRVMGELLFAAENPELAIAEAPR
jgi:hypothetical protein